MKIQELFNARHGVKNDASHGIDCSSVRPPDAMSGLMESFFYAMSSIKKVLYFHTSITYPTSAFEALTLACNPFYCTA